MDGVDSTETSLPTYQKHGVTSHKSIISLFQYYSNPQHLANLILLVSGLGWHR
jgi:hypothetical protein